MKKAIALVLLALLTVLPALAETAADPKAEIETFEGYKKLAEAEPDAFGAYPETVHISVMREYRPQAWFKEGESLEDNIWTRYYTNTLNIKYDVKQMCDQGRMAAQLDLAIAADDLPDLFDATPQQLYRLAKAGQIQPLDEVYAKYASKNMREALEIEDGLYFQQAVVDGKMYGLPETDDFYGGTPLVYFRKDWLDKLGLEVPKTLDEFEAVMDAFVNQDPDGNGEKDTFGFNLTNVFGEIDNTLDGIGHGLNFYPYTWMEKDGQLVFSDIQPEFKAVLLKLQEYYAKGYIDREFATKDYLKVDQDIAAGKIGMQFGAFPTPLGGPQSSKKNNPDAEWIVAAQPVKPDGSYKSKAVMSNYRYQVVRDGYEHPEVGIKGNNLWFELWVGTLSDTYHTLNQTEYHLAQEEFHGYPPFWFDPPKKNLVVNKNLRDAYDGGDANLLKYAEGRKHYNNIIAYESGEAGDSLYGWAESIIRRFSFLVIEEEYEPNGYVFSAYRGPVTNVIATKRPLADKVRLEQIIKFIMGEDIEAGWEAYVNSWLKSGGQDLTDEVNAWYAEQQQ